jgi:hypothetical protein
MAEKNNSFALIAIVAIVAIVGMVVMFMNSKEKTAVLQSTAEERNLALYDTEGNLVGEARKPLGQCFGANPTKCKNFAGMCTYEDACEASGGYWDSYIPKI